MTDNNVQSLNDNDLSIPSLTWGIFLISVLGLYLELLFVRWVGTEIRIFAYLQNTVLVVCFLGLGLGMFTSSKSISIKQSLVPLTVFLLLMAIPATRSFLGRISEMLSLLGDFVIWESISTDNLTANIIAVITGLGLTYILLILVVDMFVPVGRILGRLMDTHPNPIWAYSVNILGSVVGTWIFVLLSYYYQPPIIWFLVAGGLLVFFILRTNKEKAINFSLWVLILILAFFASQVPNSIDVIWSPYQKLVVRESTGFEVGDYIVTVNNAGYQGLINLDKSYVAAHPEIYEPEFSGLSQYDLPALLHPHPEKMLVVGAGTGNDAAGALRNGVKSIIAVEIDPAIINIGKDMHPEQPYSQPNVIVVNDDARSFISNTDEKFDVISFGLLDSHTTTAMTNARLDHYVYTIESIKQAKSRLNDGGIMVLSFEAQKPYIRDRIRLALKDVFQQEPLVFNIPYTSYGWGGVMFITGDLDTAQGQLDSNKKLAGYIEGLQNKYPIVYGTDTKITTDDWPYIYLASPKIPNLYYLLFGIMVLLLVRSMRKWEARINVTFNNSDFWHFFLLGAAFLLLEVQNISKASVVLGNTWQVNAVIITSVLSMALLANWIEYKFPKLSISPVYFLLIATSVGLYFIDLATFNPLPYTIKAIVVGSLTSLPMLFSGIVFIRSFARAANKSNALGANLIGALVGALMQSVTFVTGIKALLLIVAALYFLALLTAPRTERPVSPIPP